VNASFFGQIHRFSHFSLKRVRKRLVDIDSSAATACRACKRPPRDCGRKACPTWADVQTSPGHPATIIAHQPPFVTFKRRNETGELGFGRVTAACDAAALWHMG
jgi:hypothetical protein